MRHLVFNTLLFGFCFFTLSSPSFADQKEEICTSIEECQVLKDKVEQKIEDLQNNSQPLFIETDSTNEIMTNVEAVQYCKDKGGRLPSAREWAQYSKSQGAKGTLELSFVFNKLDGQAPPDYKLISAMNVDGSNEKFYYNNLGYSFVVSPNTTSYWYWSSSTHSNSSDGGYVFNESLGQLFYLSNAPHAALSVRCVSGL